MLSKVMPYMGKYRKYINAAIVVMLLGIAISVLPYLFIYQLIEPLLSGKEISVEYVVWRIVGIAVCEIAYALLYVKGLSLSHTGAYNTLKNLRISLQGKLEKI